MTITFPWGSIILFGIDKVVKYHIDSAVLRDGADLGTEQELVQLAFARTEEGHGRSLHQRMVRADRLALGGHGIQPAATR